MTPTWSCTGSPWPWRPSRLATGGYLSRTTNSGELLYLFQWFMMMTTKMIITLVLSAQSKWIHGHLSRELWMYEEPQAGDVDEVFEGCHVDESKLDKAEFYPMEMIVTNSEMAGVYCYYSVASHAMMSGVVLVTLLGWTTFSKQGWTDRQPPYYYSKQASHTQPGYGLMTASHVFGQTPYCSDQM
eukprot:GFUD01036018.1.p1 GENE.GFUD01036018.1~~GFUD01036018.1.p1  ORF type:complete len:185 (+),score=28.34 GFUD01036018.1:205-759(+)